jgi:hypothetical protein
MSLGKRLSGSTILPRLKFDARSGTYYTVIRARDNFGNWETQQHAIELGELNAVFDLQTAERGWVRYNKGAAPDLAMVLVGTEPDPRPGDDYQEAYRIYVQIDEVIYEHMSSAATAWIGMDALHDAWERERARHPGEAPVVRVREVVKRVYAGGTVAYVPSYVIAGWVKRPPEFDEVEKNGAGNAPRKPALADDDVLL